MCKCFNKFSGFLHHFVMAKLATTSIRVKSVKARILTSIVALALRLHILPIDQLVLFLCEGSVTFF